MKLREAAIACRNLILGGNLASMPMLRSPRAAVNYVSECLFLKGCLDDDGMLPQRHVWEALGWNATLNPMIDGPAATEWFSRVASWTADLISLCMLCQIVRPKTVFEIGTLHGSGALHLARNSPEARVFTLDLPPGGSGALQTTSVDQRFSDDHAGTKQMFFDGTPEASRITQLYGDSAQFDFTPWLRSVDLFFIDGAHSYEYVRSDTMKALQCCHPGSVLVWHDYGRFGVNGVSRWLHEFAAQGNQLQRIQGGSLAYMKM